MWKYSSLLWLWGCLLPWTLQGQGCPHTISGQIQDEQTGIPITDAHLFLQETQVGTLTDGTGTFILQNVCTGEYHLHISHIGCESRVLLLDIQADTQLTITMHHYGHELQSVEVSGQSQSDGIQKVQALKRVQIISKADGNLGDMLEGMTGVGLLKNGAGISKPIIHGMYGNRLTILNNGIPQSGQQWGNGHSPEIDPLAAQRITVIKGVGTLEYPGGSFGGIVLVEPLRIPNEPHLHGQVNHTFETNGLGYGLHGRIQQHHPKLAWRLSTTLKKYGDRHSPSYYLRNTGQEEAHIALQLEKELSSKWQIHSYLSSFNADWGILRGAHVGNLTDLEAALSRNEPFYTQENFSYGFDAPHQQVNHILAKHQAQYLPDGKQSLRLTYALQWNYRREYDVRRGGRSDKPALSLSQFNHYLEGQYQYHWKDSRIKTGLQLNSLDNTNVPGTGILPLIPDYLSHNPGAYLSYQWNKGEWQAEAGARYDYTYQNVVAISQGFPREILRYRNHFHTGNVVLAAAYHPHAQLKAQTQLGWASRQPGINELYSNGLHQGVGSIEEGDPGLGTEHSLKGIYSLGGRITKGWFYESLWYVQGVWDYIYLAPQDELRLTIRGAFPVFRYEQTDALLLGWDASTSYHPNEAWMLHLQYSYLRGQDTRNDLPLIYMPANRLRMEVTRHIPKIGPWSNISISLQQQYVARQGRWEEEQDFVPPPPAYYLLGLGLSLERPFRSYRLNIRLRGDNLLNTRYRDYLNRLRYFADETGRTLVLGLSLEF